MKRTFRLILILSPLFGLFGCVSDEEVFTLQSDLTRLETRVQKMETGSIKQTQDHISEIEQSQRNQTGSLDQVLTRVSQVEKNLDSLSRQQKSLSERLDRMERSQLQLKQSVQTDLDELEKRIKASQTSSLNSLRQEFNRAQKEMGESWDKNMAKFSKDIGSRIRKMDNEITNFYNDLERTLQGYSSGTYVVKPGDSLSKIAQQLGVSVEELSKANNISDPGKIRVGQELVIP